MANAVGCCGPEAEKEVGMAKNAKGRVCPEERPASSRELRMNLEQLKRLLEEGDRLRNEMRERLKPLQTATERDLQLKLQ